ncbi:MAG: putative quinol monooxygenase [Pirellulales bacterium]
MIHVIATIELHPGRRDDFLREFHRIVPPVLAEQGCLEYGPTVDVDTGLSAQLPLRANVVTIVEKWESLEALKAHLVAPHMVEYRPRVKDMVIRTTLQVLEPA